MPENKTKTTELSEKLFYFAYCVLLIKYLIGYSTLSVYIPVDGMIGNVFRIFAYLLCFYKICRYDRFDRHTIINYIAFFVLIVVIILVSKNYGLLDVAVIIIGSHGINFKKIIKLFFYTATVATLFLMLLSLCGVIENYTTYKDDGTPRYAFGNVYATDFAARIFYLQLCYAYLRKNKYNLPTFIFWCAVGLFIWKFCGARLDTVLIFLFNIVCYLYSKFPGIFKVRAISFLLAYSMVILCLIALMLHIAYNPESELSDFLNRLLSGRLSIGKEGIDKYGFSLFGKEIEMQGWGFSLTEFDEVKGYFFLDCGFLNLSLCDGLIYLVLTLISYVYVARLFIKNDNYVLVIIITFIALSSVVDHHLNDLAYNPFIFIIGVALQNFGKRKYFNVKKENLVLTSN